jgi:two-component system, cell cycle sensor histidine kinase and response regulator CckA
MAEEYRARVAAELAHEVCNVVQLIDAVGVMLQSRVDEEAGLLLDDLVACGGRASHLAKRLMALAREELTGGEPMNLSAAVAAEIAVMRRLAPAGVTVTDELEPEPLHTMLAIRDVQQVMQNLARNAFDAMPNGGTLRICLRRTEPHAELSIVDSGNGMTDETRARCLELFFTTKPETGTGVGLYSVRSTVERVGGRIIVDSAPGAGTTVTMLVPLVAHRS